MEKAKKAALVTVVSLSGVCGLGALALFYIPAKNASSWDANEKAAARKEGIPLETADLMLPQAPDDQNAAVVYQEMGDVAEKTAKKLNIDSFRLLDAPMVAGLTGFNEGGKKPQTKAEIQAQRQKQSDGTLPALEPIFGLLSELDSRPKCDFLPPSGKADYEHHVFRSDAFQLNKVVHDLCYRADYQDRHGDWKGALKSMAYACRISVDLDSLPAVMTLLDRNAAQVRCVFEYVQMAKRHRDNAAFLVAAESQALAETELPDLRRDLGGEVVFQRSVLHTINKLSDVPSDDPSSEDGTSGEAEKKRKGDFIENFRLKSMSSQTLQAELDARLLSAWRMIWPSIPNDSKGWRRLDHTIAETAKSVEAQNSRLGDIVSQSLSGLSDLGISLCALEAKQRMLICSLALLRFRAETGKTPARLPESLGQYREDPFTGEPFHYQRDGKGFRLTSPANQGAVANPASYDPVPYDKPIVLEFD